MIDVLEPRRLMAAPAVLSVGVIGTAEEVTGIVLTFGVPLDPASAQNLKAYSISRKIQGKESNFGVIDTSSDGKKRRVRFISSVYDPAAQTVTLTPSTAFFLPRKFRRMFIDAGGANAVKEASGTPIDGDGDGRPGGNQLFHVKVIKSPHFKYKEPDGDVAKVTLDSRGGRLWAWEDKNRTVAPILLISKTEPANSTLTGTVKRGRHGDGIVTIHQIAGTSLAAVPLLNDPAFHVQVASP